MKIGFIGLGKLGLPVAVAMAWRGAEVVGNDIDPKRMLGMHGFMEEGPLLDGTKFQEYLSSSTIKYGSVEDAVRGADAVFVAVQTPHDDRFDGARLLTDFPVDFDYTALRAAVASVAKTNPGRNNTPLVVISTVLPGTMEREIVPLLEGSKYSLVYNPFFIAMGTTMHDFLNPEFVLLGVDDHAAASRVSEIYQQILPAAPQRTMSIASAELTKVCYNTVISQKIVLANTIMELAHKCKANCDDVTSALQSARDRITSGAYMTGGMGDGGGCHPRDNIALWWLADKLDLSYNPFKSVTLGREQQSWWLAEMAASHAQMRMPITIAGYAFKPGTNIITGSPALLLASQIEMIINKPCEMFDPHVTGKGSFPYRSDKPVVVVLGCKHPQFYGWDGSSLAKGSVIIDPFRITGQQADGITIVKVGIGT